MESEILKIQASNDIGSLQKYVRELSVDFLCSEISRICRSENGAVVLQILFGGLTQSVSCQEKRIKVTRMVLGTIEKNLISPRLTEKLVTVLSAQTESFSAENVIDLIDFCLKMMRDAKDSDGCNCWRYLLPKLLNKIEEEVYIVHNGTHKSGSEYKSEIVTAICISSWPDSILTNITSMFMDITLTNDEHLRVVDKLCSRIPFISLEEVPPLVHEMLQLTKEVHFTPFFLALAELFDNNLYADLNNKNNNLPGRDLENFQTVESTVLYHIYTVVSSLGPQSVKDFIKILKDSIFEPSFILSPFCVTFLLTISSVSYVFEEEILNLLRSAIIRNYGDEEKISDSAWIETIVNSSVSTDGLFNKIMENCSREKDKVLKGLVNLGFILLSTPKSRGKEVQSTKAWELGCSILVTLINKYSAITSSVLQTLANQISQVHESTKYTDCLFRIVRKNPLNVLDCSSVLLQLLDNIWARLPGDVGKRIVTVILPLTKMSQSLRDNLIIILRKSLFPLHRACREMAVIGILELLKDLKISNMRNLSQSISQSYSGLTQIYSETCTGPGCSYSNEGLCLELLSILKEVFKYQYEVKIVFYKGIYESVYANPELECHVLDNLQNQFDKFYINGNEIPPLHFDSTMTIHGSKPILQEPVAQLIFSMALIFAKMEERSKKNGKMREMFYSLCQRMSDSDVPHFILGKENFDGGAESLVKEEKIRQILGVYEALMGYVLSTWTKDSTTEGHMLNSLFRGYSRLSDYARSIGKPEKKKAEEKPKNVVGDEIQYKKKNKNKICNFQFPSTVLNFKCAARLLSILHEDSVSWASEDSKLMIKNKRELHRYCFNVILTLLKEASSLSDIELSKNSNTWGYLMKIGRIIFTRCVKGLGEMKTIDLQSAVLSVECFIELINLVKSHFGEKFPNFLGILIGHNSGCALNTLLESTISIVLDEFQSLVNDTMQEEATAAKEEETLNRKLSLLLISLASNLARQLIKGVEAQEALNKVKKICKDTSITNPNVAKSILTFLISLYMKCKTPGSLLLDMTLCLCKHLSLIDNEVKIDQHTDFAVVNEHTANSCILSVCDALRDLLNEVEWIIARLKAELQILFLSSKILKGAEQGRMEEKEKELCRHINFCMKVLSVLSTIAIPPGIYADSVLREIGNFYNKATMATKYFILKVGKYHQNIQHSKFDKTVKMIDHELSKNMYYFTEHVISDGTANIGDSSLKQGKKDPAFLKYKCMRETKIIPKVIYEKEQFQKFVLQLSNKAKINLAGQTKHALARDYRLYAKQVKEILERENIQSENKEVEDENTSSRNEEGDESYSKRPKLDG